MNVHAAANAEEMIKYRHLVMDSMAANMGALMQVLLGKVEIEGTVEGHANALVVASDALDQMFPDYSREGDTEALPAIWNSPDAFGKAVEKAKKTAKDLQVAIASDDRKATLSAAAAVGKSCKGCHESYRAEEED